MTQKVLFHRHCERDLALDSTLNDGASTFFISLKLMKIHKQIMTIANTMIGQAGSCSIFG